LAVWPRKQSPQHNVLRDFSAKEPLVYYVGPLFRTTNEFDTLFTNDEITIHSAFIPINKLPKLTDDDQHYITYDIGGSGGFKWHSDEIRSFDTQVNGSYWLGYV